MDSQIVVTPVKTGVQGFYNYLNLLENGPSATFCETVTFNSPLKVSLGYPEPRAGHPEAKDLVLWLSANALTHTISRTTIKAEAVPVKFKNSIKT
jgi:hypothetical protein